MRADFINPFIAAAKNVLATMANTTAEAGKPGLKTDRCTWGDVTGVIGLCSPGTSGSMLLSFSKGAILSVVNQMLGEEHDSINEEVADAVGELTNMITGAAKNGLIEKGYKIDMAIPIIIQGKNVQITQIANGPILTVPFTIPGGCFVVEANLVDHK